MAVAVAVTLPLAVGVVVGEEPCDGLLASDLSFWSSSLSLSWSATKHNTTQHNQAVTLSRAAFVFFILPCCRVW